MSAISSKYTAVVVVTNKILPYIWGSDHEKICPNNWKFKVTVVVTMGRIWTF